MRIISTDWGGALTELLFVTGLFWLVIMFVWRLTAHTLATMFGVIGWTP